MSKDYREFSKAELATNVVNQLLDQVVRTEIDLKYFVKLEVESPHTSKQREMWTGQIKLIHKKLKEIRKKYNNAKLYLKELEKENEQTKA